MVDFHWEEVEKLNENKTDTFNIEEKKIFSVIGETKDPCNSEFLRSKSASEVRKIVKPSRQPNTHTQQSSVHGCGQRR